MSILGKHVLNVINAQELQQIYYISWCWARCDNGPFEEVPEECTAVWDGGYEWKKKNI